MHHMSMLDLRDVYYVYFITHLLAKMKWKFCYNNEQLDYAVLP